MSGLRRPGEFNPNAPRRRAVITFGLSATGAPTLIVSFLAVVSVPFSSSFWTLLLHAGRTYERRLLPPHASSRLSGLSLPTAATSARRTHGGRHPWSARIDGIRVAGMITLSRNDPIAWESHRLGAVVRHDSIHLTTGDVRTLPGETPGRCPISLPLRETLGSRNSFSKISPGCVASRCVEIRPFVVLSPVVFLSLAASPLKVKETNALVFGSGFIRPLPPSPYEQTKRAVQARPTHLSRDPRLGYSSSRGPTDRTPALQRRSLVDASTRVPPGDPGSKSLGAASLRQLRPTRPLHT